MPVILVLDDDPTFRHLCKSALTNAGYEVVAEPKAKPVLARGPQWGFDAAVVDGLLPDMKGQDFIDVLRKQGFTGPIIFISAFFRDIDTYRRLTNLLKVAKVLHKPVPANEIAAAVAAFVPLAPPVEETIDVTDAHGLTPSVAALPVIDFETIETMFIEITADRTLQIGAVAERLRRGRAQAGDLEALNQLFDKINGSAEPSGFAALGLLARGIQGTVQSHIDGVPLDARSAERLAADCNVFMEMFERERSRRG